MISVEDLVVVYPDGTKAVDGISFTVKEGSFSASPARATAEADTLL